MIFWVLGIGLFVIYTLVVLYLGCLMGYNSAKELDKPEKVKNYWKGDE